MDKYDYVGKRIRKERLKYGLSLNELAKATELSPSFLSLLENGKTTPSLKVLDKLCTHFSIHMAALFEEEEDQNELMYPESRQISVDETGRNLTFLLPKTKAGIEPVFITMMPGPQTHDFTSHEGLEFGYILEGIIEVHIKGKEPMVCHKGDSVLYRSNNLHKLVNPSDGVAKGLWIGLPGVESF